MSISRTEAQVDEIVQLVQAFDDLLTSLTGPPRHRRVVDPSEFVDADPPTRVTPPWPWTPKHVASTNGDAA